MRRQQRNIFFAFAQRRNRKLNRVETEQQIRTETAFSAFQLQVSVRGGDHADIDFVRLRRTHALHLAGFQHAQKLGLLLHRDVGDFVEKQRAAVRQFKASDPVCARVSKCAFHVAKQLAFKSAFRQAAGVHGDHWPSAARRKRVQRLRHNFFAGAVLAGNQDVGIAWPNAAQQSRAAAPWLSIPQ